MMMSRRAFLGSVGLGALCAVGSGGAAPTKRPPNILFLYTDDQSYETIRALGFDELHTPNLDRLVRAGTTFTHAYNQGGWHGALSVASRTMMLTGRFLWNAGALEPVLDEEVSARRFWPQLLHDAGYDTWFTGKWHVQTDVEKAFDHVVTLRPGGMPPSLPHEVPEAYDRPKDGEPDPWDPTDPKFGGYWTGGRHWTEALADDAEGMLAEASKQDKPFFMYLAFNAPHDPRQSPGEYLDLYPPESVRVPENFLPQHPDYEAIGCTPGTRDEALAPFPRTEHAVRTHRREYYAIISHLDAQIGRILDALEASGQADSTVIFLGGDQGLAVGHHGLMGKQNLYDHSVRVPLIVAGPGIPADQRIDTPVYLQDLMPTALDLAGAPVPDHVQFRSLLPLIRGARDAQYEAIYGGYMMLQRMVTKEGFKLIYYPKLDRRVLYDLTADPQEMHDLAQDPAQAERVEALWAALLELQPEMGDPLTL